VLSISPKTVTIITTISPGLWRTSRFLLVPPTVVLVMEFDRVYMSLVSADDGGATSKLYQKVG